MKRNEFAGPFANKSGKTSIKFNEFTYTWLIEDVIACRSDTPGEFILSPLFTVYNRNDKFEFQLKAYPGGYSYNDLNGYFCVDLIKLLSTASSATKAFIEICIMNKNVQEVTGLNGKEAFIAGGRDATKIAYNYLSKTDIFERHLSNSSLTIKCRIRFRNGITYDEFKADPNKASAISKLSIQEDFGKLLEAPKFSDVTVVVGDKAFPVHKSILSARCRVFAAMLEHEMKESKENIIKFDEEDPDTMAEVLHFIYTGNVRKMENLATELLAAADKYQLDALRLMCEEALIAKLSLGNIGEILKLVDLYETTRLHESAMKFLAIHGSEVAALANYDAIMKTLSPALLLKVTKVLMQRP